MKPFFALVKRELASVARERTILIAIAIQLFIASFSSALLLGLLSLYDPDSVTATTRVNMRVGVVGELAGALTPLLQARGLRVVSFTTLEQARQGYQNNQVDTVIVAPRSENEIVTLQLFVPRAEARASLIQLLLQEPLKEYENILRAENGLNVRYTDLKGAPPTTFEFLYSVILPLLLFFPAFVAGNLVADSLSEEFEMNTLDTLLAAPLSLRAIVGAKIFAAVVLAVLQGALWLGLLTLNRTELHHIPLLLVMGGALAGMFAVAAAIVAVAFKNREQAQFVYALLLIGGMGASFLLGVSPLTTIARLAIGDAFTGGGNVLWYVAALGVMMLGLQFALTQRART